MHPADPYPADPHARPNGRTNDDYERGWVPAGSGGKNSQSEKNGWQHRAASPSAARSQGSWLSDTDSKSKMKSLPELTIGSNV